MLLRLKVENFYSIKEEQILDLTVPAKSPKDERFAELAFDPHVRVAKVFGLIGPNASGKTTFLRAISFFWHFILRSFDRYEADDDIIINPFGDHSEGSSVSKIAIEFCPSPHMRNEVNVYSYEIHIRHGEDRNYVEFERLAGGKTFGKYSEIFCRRIIDGKTVVAASKKFELPNGDPRAKVRRNVSLLSNLIQFDHEPAQKVYEEVVKSFMTNVSVGKFSYNEDFVMSYLDDRPHAVDDLKKFLRFIDVGIKDFEIIEHEGKKVPIFIHKGRYSISTLPYESQGTRNFFSLFPMLIAAMKTGSTAIIDELDSDLHPHLVAEIIRWFQRNEESLPESQLITALNHPSVLNSLFKEEVALVEKGENGASYVTHVKDIDGVRRDTNLYRKYMSGAFGAIPAFG